MAPQPVDVPAYLGQPAPAGDAQQPSQPRLPTVPAELLARQAPPAVAETPVVTPTVLTSPTPIAPAVAPAAELPRVAPPGAAPSYQTAPQASLYASAPAPSAPAPALEAGPSAHPPIPGFTPAPTILALPAMLGASTTAAAPSASPTSDTPHPTTAPSATPTSVSQPISGATGSDLSWDANSAYLAALGITAPGAPAQRGAESPAPTTGPQPVALPHDGGPLSPAPATALPLPQQPERGLDLTPDGRGDLGAPMHRV